MGLGEYARASHEKFIHREMDAVATRTKQLLGLITEPKSKSIILRYLPHLQDELELLKYFESGPEDSMLGTMIGRSRKTEMLTDRLWWGHLARLAGDSEDAKGAVVHGIRAGDIFMGGKKAPGSYWLNMEADEAASEKPVKITGIDGVHMHEIVVAHESVSYAQHLQRALAQLGVEMVGNIADRAADDHDFSQAKKDRYRIPRTSRPGERKMVQKNAQVLLTGMKSYSHTEFVGCTTLESIAEKIKTFPQWAECEEVRLVRKDGRSFRMPLSEFGLMDKDRNKLIEMLNERSEKKYLETPKSGDDGTIPIIGYFDILGLSHIHSPLTTEQHTHDMSIWIDSSNGVGTIYDRQLPITNGDMGFKVRIFANHPDGGNSYIDTTIDRILEMGADELTNILQDPSQINTNIIIPDNSPIAKEPPMFVLSHSADGNTQTDIYRHRAAKGKAVSHLIYNEKKKSIELFSSHGAVDGVEAKWMALAAGYAVGTRDEKVEDSFHIMPHHTSLVNVKDPGIIRVLDRLGSFMSTPNERQQKQAVDNLLLHDVVSFRSIDFKKDIKTHLANINESFQKPLQEPLEKALDEIGVDNPSDRQIIIDLLTPEYGMSNVLSAVSEYVFGKTAVCVQPIRREHRLSLALTPDIASLVGQLTDRNFKVEEFTSYIEEIETKMMEATHQTNLFSKLSIGHIQMLYLAAQNWRGLAEGATGWIQQPLVDVTRVRAQVSSLGPSSEKKFTHVSPISNRLPTTRSFVSALSGEDNLHTSIAFEGSSLSFRQHLTPELFDSFSFNDDETFLNRKSTNLVLHSLYGSDTAGSGNRLKCLDNITAARIEFHKIQSKEGLTNSQTLARLQTSPQWETHKDAIKTLTLILMQERIDAYMRKAKRFVKNLSTVFAPDDKAVTPESAQAITQRLLPTDTLKLKPEELGK